jgi:2-polyprenyl-6-methoxyphenol hydroxylase-like FAD-dependent oxidoreductase
MMLAFLLARMGVPVIVLEKHADFLRDFRGDTIHPSTLELMYELGLLDEFLRRPHQEVTELAAQVGNELLKFADLTHLPTHCKMLALMPHWDFLNFLADHGRRYPGFRVEMKTEAVGLLEESGRVVGITATNPQGAVGIRATLTVGADGRHSTVREKAGLEVRVFSAPIDVLWFRISRDQTDDPRQTLGHAAPGKFVVLINREEYWQVGYVIAKGAFEGIKSRGIESFREELTKLQPFLRDRVSELRDWTDVSLLTVKVDRLRRWSKPGLLCIGDSAHAMSPIGGVGINLAIQDAVATANILGPKLKSATFSDRNLEEVQKRRDFPTRATQRLQVLAQNRLVEPLLTTSQPLAVPWPLKIMQHWSWLRRIPARVIGVGFRPEHIRTPDILSASGREFS